MSLIFDLPMKLYSELEDNNLLSLVEAITNEKNFISVDLYDIEVFDRKKYLGRIDYINKDAIPEFNKEADSLLVCFNINKNTTLGDIAKEVDKLTEAFKTNSIVFGTNTDESLENGIIKVTCLMFESPDLKKLFDEKFYNDLRKCNFIKDIEEMLSYNALINIDAEDFAKLAKGEVIGSISQTFNNLDEKYKINKISDKEPTDCIFNVTSGTNLGLKDVDKLIDKLRLLYPNMNIIFGTTILEQMSPLIKVQALLTHSK